MGGFCGGGGSKTSSRSAGRGSGGGSAKPSTVDKIATDIKMGLSTIGQSKAQQAQTFRNQGYSERAIQSYQERSAASAAAARAEMDRISRDNNRSSRAAATTTSEDTSADTATTRTTVLPPEVDRPLTNVETVSTNTFVPDPPIYTYPTYGGPSVGTAAGGVAEYNAAIGTSVGQAEDEALELMKKGRRATILTKPGGLLGSGEEEGKTRRRRSLIGG
jgi:hypothetical protein